MKRFSYANLLKNALYKSGFIRRGSTFYRVWGDGVLQVLKFERQCGDQVYELRFGVFSMYGVLYPHLLTSKGCIVAESISNFVGLSCVDGWISPDFLKKTENGDILYDEFPISVNSTQRLRDKTGEYLRCYFTPEQQINILVERAIPWLNAITCQSLIAKAIYEMFRYPSNHLLFDAHLAAGEWIQAEQNMLTILKQHADAQESWEKSFSKEKFDEMVARQDIKDVSLKSAIKMVQEKDEDAISCYLNTNYKRNCELLKFCMK